MRIQDQFNALTKQFAKGLAQTGRGLVPASRNLSRLATKGGISVLRNPQYTHWYPVWRVPNTEIDYRTKVGDPMMNSALASVVGWVARNFPEAPAQVFQVQEGNLLKQVVGHDMEMLLRKPNPFYNSRSLWQGVLVSWFVDGNAYILKRRDKTGKVVELYYFPHFYFEPRGNENTFITHYEYTGNTDGVLVKVDPKDIVHLRNGIDPDNYRRGQAPIRSILREIFMDNEAVTFSTALLTNMGVPSFIISPSDPDTELDDEAAEAIKSGFSKNFTGDHRGEPMVMTSGVKLDKVQLSPAELDLAMLHRLPEERIAAVIGIPPMVAGLGAGLDASTMSNYKEAREMAYESTIVPIQRDIAEQLWAQLLPDFEEDVTKFEVAFNLANVRVLQADENAKATRLDIMVRGGWMKVSEARQAMGLPTDPEDEIYLRKTDPNAMGDPNNPDSQSANGHRTNVPHQRLDPNSTQEANRQAARQQQSVTPEAPKKEWGPIEYKGLSFKDAPVYLVTDDEIDLARHFYKTVTGSLDWTSGWADSERTRTALSGVIDSASANVKSCTLKLASELNSVQDEEGYKKALDKWVVETTYWSKMAAISACVLASKSDLPPSPVLLLNLQKQADTIVGLAKDLASGKIGFEFLRSLNCNSVWAIYDAACQQGKITDHEN